MDTRQLYTNRMALFTCLVAELTGQIACVISYMHIIQRHIYGRLSKHMARSRMAETAILHVLPVHPCTYLAAIYKEYAVHVHISVATRYAC